MKYWASTENGNKKQRKKMGNTIKSKQNSSKRHSSLGPPEYGNTNSLTHLQHCYQNTAQ